MSNVCNWAFHANRLARDHLVANGRQYAHSGHGQGLASAHYLRHFTGPTNRPSAAGSAARCPSRSGCGPSKLARRVYRSSRSASWPRFVSAAKQVNQWKMAHQAAFPRPAGRFPRVWQALVSNQRRLSRWFKTAPPHHVTYPFNCANITGPVSAWRRCPLYVPGPVPPTAATDRHGQRPQAPDVTQSRRQRHHLAMPGCDVQSRSNCALTSPEFRNAAHPRDAGLASAYTSGVLVIYLWYTTAG
jgi:hypothetical protein